MGWVVNATPRPLYPREISIVYEYRWTPAPVWMGTENFDILQAFDPQTVQPLASRYTNWDIPSTFSIPYLFVEKLTSYVTKKITTHFVGICRVTLTF